MGCWADTCDPFASSKKLEWKRGEPVEREGERKWQKKEVASLVFIGFLTAAWGILV